jgi:hypothetical protein
MVAGPAPGRGLVLTGTMMASLRLAYSVVTGHLGERPGPDGSELVVTVIDPPVPGPASVVLAATTAGRLLPHERRPGWRVRDGSTP